MNVAVLGASNKPERYSYQAVRLLMEKGHAAFPVHPAAAEVAGRPVFKRLAEVPAPLDTISVYLGAERSSALAEEILAANPRRVILNPGAENPDLARRLAAGGVEVVNACTLVMLRTGQFDRAGMEQGA
jgi:predicted CoA-binding protein